MPREILDDCRICLDMDTVEGAVKDANEETVGFERVHARPDKSITTAPMWDSLPQRAKVYGNLDLAKMVLRSTRKCAQQCSGKTPEGMCGQPDLRNALAKQRPLPDLA